MQHINHLNILHQQCAALLPLLFLYPSDTIYHCHRHKEEAGKAILLACKSVKAKESIDIGSYKGFDMSLSYDSFTQEFHLDLQREMTYGKCVY